MEELKRRGYSSSRQSYGRSRYTSRTTGKTTPKSDFREVILTQCIICGIVLIFTLVISLFDSGITNSIRNTMKTALSGEAGIDSLANGLDELSQSYNGVKSSLNVIFGKTPDATDLPLENELTLATGVLENSTPDINTESTAKENKPADETEPEVEAFNQAIPEQEVFNQLGISKNENTASIFDEDFRIDEDILAQLDSVVDFYNNTNQTFIKK